jgi:lactoylglutathione lyase
VTDVQHHSHLALRVKDLERSVRFYTEVVGLSILEPVKPGAPPLVVMREGLGLKPVESGQKPGRSGVIDHIAFRVTSLEPVLARLSAARVSLADGPRPSPYGQSVYFLDPDGNKIECHDGDRK